MRKRTARRWLAGMIFASLCGLFAASGCGRFPVARISDEMRRRAPSSQQRVQLPEAALAGAAPQGFVTQVLDNGLRVSILPDAMSPTVALRMFYNVGIAHQPPSSPELAHLIEHMVFNPPIAGAEKPRLLESLRHHGAQLSASTEAELTIYKTEVPKAALDLALQAEARRLSGVDLTEKDLQAQKKSVQEEFQMRFSLGPGLVTGFDALHRLLRGHPYANYFSPRRNLDAVSLQQVSDFLAQHYQPQSAHLVLVGDVDVVATLGRVRELFGGLQNRPRAAISVPPLVDWDIPKSAELSQDQQPVKAAVSIFVMPPPSHPDNLALAVLANMLCKKWTLSICLDDRNALFESMVKKDHSALVAGFGYVGAYDWGTTDTELGITPFRGGSALAFFAVYLPHRMKRTALRMLDEQLATLGRLDWLTEDNLRRAKHVLRKRIRLETYSPTNRAEALGKSQHLQDDARYAFVREPAIEAVTQQDIKRVYARYLQQQEPVSIYVVPEKVPAWMRLFSWLYPAVYGRIKHPLVTHD